MELSKAKRTLVLIILGTIGGLVYLIPLIRYTFYDQMMEALHLTDAQIGDIGAVYGIGNVVCYLISGYLADRYDPRNLFLVCTGGMALTTFWYATLPSFGAVLVIHVLYSLFSVGLWWSPYLKAVRLLFREDQQSYAYGLGESIRGVGQAIVAFIGLGAMAAAINVVAGFRWVILVNAIAFTIMFFAVLFFYPASHSGTKNVSLMASIKHMFGFLKTRSAWTCILVIICGYCAWITSSTYYGTYCTRVLNMPESMSSMISIIRNYVIVIGAGVIGGKVNDAFKRKGNGFAMFFAIALVSSALLLVTENHSMLTGVIMTLIACFAVNAILSTYWSTLGPAGISAEETGSATGAISVIALSPDIFACSILGRLIQRAENAGNVVLGFHQMIWWMVAWCALGVIGSLLLVKRQKNVEAGIAKP